MLCACPGSGAGAFVNCVASVKLPIFKGFVEYLTSNSVRSGLDDVVHESETEVESGAVAEKFVTGEGALDASTAKGNENATAITAEKTPVRS